MINTILAMMPDIAWLIISLIFLAIFVIAILGATSKQIPPEVKFKWVYQYVPEGQLEPDNYNRWQIKCYVEVHILRALPEYSWLIKSYKTDYVDIAIAAINQKGTLPGNVPSLIHRFGAECISFNDSANIGMSRQTNFFSNDVEELKKIVEAEYRKVKLVFDNLKMEYK